MDHIDCNKEKGDIIETRRLCEQQAEHQEEEDQEAQDSDVLRPLSNLDTTNRAFDYDMVQTFLDTTWAPLNNEAHAADYIKHIYTTVMDQPFRTTRLALDYEPSRRRASGVQARLFNLL